jgi:hypothetical protein
MLFDEKLGYERLDVCEACWVAQYSLGATSRKGFISHWQGVYELPTAEPEAIRKENAESLLRKLVERNDPRHADACFILAVMLERKRVFKVKDQIKRDGQRVFIYEQPKTGDVFTIIDPNLRLDQLDAVQRDLADLLEDGLNPPPAEPADPPVPDGDGGASQPGASETAPTPSAKPEDLPISC